MLHLRLWGWVALMVCFAILPLPRMAVAQSAGNPNKPTIHVFPVEVFGKIGATDPVSLQNAIRNALAAELKRSGKWEYKTKPPTIEKYGRQPQNMSEQDRRREPAYYVRTSVIWLNYHSPLSSRPGVCRLGIFVRVHDSMTGEVVNGADAKGYSRHSLEEGFPKKFLIQEAIQDTARNAIRTINNYEIPEGHIIDKQNDEWILERSKGVFRPEMELVVIHNNRKFAILRVTRVEPRFVFAAAADVPKPPALEDRAFAICRMSHFGPLDEDSIKMADSPYYDLYP